MWKIQCVWATRLLAPRRDRCPMPGQEEWVVCVPAVECECVHVYNIFEVFALVCVCV